MLLRGPAGPDSRLRHWPPYPIKLLHIVPDHDVAIHGHERCDVLVVLRREEIVGRIIMSRLDSHDAKEGIIEHVVGERHISSFEHHAELFRTFSLILRGCVHPERDVDHGERNWSALWPGLSVTCSP